MSVNIITSLHRRAYLIKKYINNNFHTYSNDVYKSYLLIKEPKLRRFVTFSKLGNYGRLGNQLFQYALLKSYAKYNNIPILLPPYNEHRLGDFKINHPSFPVNYLELASNYQYTQDSFHFIPNYINFHKRINFEGFFQSEKYFSNIKEDIIKEFQLCDNNKIQFATKLIKNLKALNSNKTLVSVHVRRGDNVPSEISYGDKYIGAYRQDKEIKHPLLKVDYYRNAMQLFSNSIYIFFSDTDQDIEWCKKTFENDTNIFLHYDDLTDFTIMQMCDHNIISNSTFSWWAAWLNNNKEKRIIYPSIWFGEYYAHWDLKDLLPGNWRKI